MKQKNIVIRLATLDDVDILYRIGLDTVEFSVSATFPFMEKDEFIACVQNTRGVFLVAESESHCVGFIYANQNDPEITMTEKWACIVYVVVIPEYRKLGIAQQLLNACIALLKERGLTRVYVWGNAEGDGSIISFMKKNQFQEGHTYVWMDRSIAE